MDLITFATSIVSSLVATVAFEAFSGWLEKRRGRLKVQVGRVSVDLDLRDPESAARELAAHMGDPQVFISHSFRDEGFAHRLASDLKRRDLRVWLPSNEIKAGASLEGKILEGLQSSGYMIAVISERSRDSASVLHEIKLAIEREKAGKWPKVIPVRIDRSDVPELLEDKVWIDMSSNYEKSLSALVDRVRGSRQ